MDKVSIITPCYNASAFLNITYNALREQTHSNWEWVVVDDCSTDNSFEIMKNLCLEDSRVLLVSNSENSGAAVTRNNALNDATGNYCAFLDADDLWDSKKLKRQLEFMKTNDIDFSYHNYWTVDAKGTKLKKQTCPSEMSAHDLLKYNPFATSSVVIKRDLIEKNHIRFKEHLRRRQDYFFWYDALKVCKVAKCLNEELSQYRIFGTESLSANKKKMAIIQWNLYRQEFKIGLIPSIYYFIHYAIHGLKKYFL
jgi:teichuronic acid biosynthesis glycosyltransferase TuaG